MTDYTDLLLANLEPGDPLTDEIVQAFYLNLLAAMEGSAGGDGAPVNQAMWHPYDMVKVGDGNDGVFYDFAGDGAVASIDTPTFEDGYEYRVVGTSLGSSNGLAATLQVQFYKATDGALTSAQNLGANGGSSNVLAFRFDVERPRQAQFGCYGSGITSNNSSGLPAVITAAVSDTTLQKIDYLRFAWSAGNFNAGTMILYRRRVIY